MIPESSVSLRRGENGKYIVTADDSQNEYPTLGAALDELKWLRNPDADSSHTTRESVLDAAKRCVCGDRDKQYGPPENSFRSIARLWNAYLEDRVTIYLDAKDVAIMMCLFKIARMMTGTKKEDSWVDACGYLACGAEIDGGK